MKELNKKFFINQYLQEEYRDGGVGCTDAEKILLSKGFEPITFPHHYNFSLKAKISRLFFLLKKFRAIKGGSAVVFIYPLYATMDRLLVRLLLLKKRVSIVCFIVDIDGIKDGDEKLLQKEIIFFKRFRYFILLNESMKRWLDERVPGNFSSQINFHGFLTRPVSVVRQKSFEIVFAGNLGKSIFLEKLHLLRVSSPHLLFNLFGPGKTPGMDNQANVMWHGVENPYDLPAKLNGSFGLVWDGDSIDKPGGSLGDYMQYISHHKLSLYILSKLPIIVPATAASAPLIEKYRIGFAINNLYEIEDKINKLPASEYQQMQINMNSLAEKISKGECLGDAIDEILKLTED